MLSLIAFVLSVLSYAIVTLFILLFGAAIGYVIKEDMSAISELAREEREARAHMHA